MPPVDRTQPVPKQAGQECPPAVVGAASGNDLATTLPPIPFVRIANRTKFAA